MEKTMTAIEVKRSSRYKISAIVKKKSIHEIILLVHPVSNLGAGQNGDLVLYDYYR